VYLLVDKLGFPQLPIGMLFDRAVSFYCSLDSACNVEDGRHGGSGWDGWFLGKRGISDKVGVAVTKSADHLMTQQTNKVLLKLLLLKQLPNIIHLHLYMASSQTSLPRKTGPDQNQRVYQPGFEDFGFDALEISDTENTAAAPLETEDFGFDDPEQSGMDGAEDFGMDGAEDFRMDGAEDFGMDGAEDLGIDGLTLPEALQPEAQGDEDFGMDSPHLPDDQEFFGCPVAARGRSSVNMFQYHSDFLTLQMQIGVGVSVPHQ
jgi:hypothetical protein